MDLEQDYIVYALEVSLTFIAVSSAYFIDISRPLTMLALLPTTVLFGYTAYISRFDFKMHSTLSLLGLAFVMLGGPVAAVAVLASVGNVLVSIFSSGEGFRNFYGATSLPLLFSGMIMGAAVYGMAVSNPSFATTLQEETADYAGEQAELIVNRSNMLESRKDGQKRVVNTTATTTLRLVKTNVLSKMNSNSTMSRDELIRLSEAFDSSESIVQERIVERSSEKIDESSIDISERVADLVTNSLKGKTFLLIVPIVTFGVYGVHPVAGILTAVWASIFAALGGRKEEDSDSKELDSDFEL